MGLLDRLAGGSGQEDDDGDDGPPQKYRVAVQDVGTGQWVGPPDGVEASAWTFEGEPLTEEQFKYRHGEHVEPGLKYVCCALDGNRNPDFDRVQWSFESEQERRDGEIQMLRREIQDLKEGGPTALDPEADVEDVLFLELMRGNIGIDEAEHVVGLKAQLEQAKHGDHRNYFDDVDPDDRDQILGATAMQWADSYDGVGEAVEDLVGGLTRGVVGPAANLAGAAGDAGADDGTRQAELTEAAGEGEADDVETEDDSTPSAQRLAESGGLSGGPGAVDPAGDDVQEDATDDAEAEGEQDAADEQDAEPAQDAEAAQEPPDAQADGEPGEESAATDGGEWRPQTPEALEAADWNDLQKLGKDLGVYRRGMSEPELRLKLGSELFDDGAATGS